MSYGLELLAANFKEKLVKCTNNCNAFIIRL